MLHPMQGGGRPHWEARYPKELWPAFTDFRNFLGLVWQHLGLPEPTPAQYEIAHRLQYGADSVEWDRLTPEEQRERYESVREDIVRAFRGIGKSYTTSGFAIWLLMRNPRDEKILVVSASGTKATAFVDQTKGVIQSMPLVMWLLDGPREKGARRRDMSDKFDVAGASLSQSFSVRAAGITGQITGDRATTLIADDIEIPQNSKTEDARGQIIQTVRSDFAPITKTEHGKGDQFILGTPQTEESVYNVMVEELGFTCFCIPARWPSAEKRENYVLKTKETKVKVDILAPFLQAAFDAGTLQHGQNTDTRFGDDELIKAEAKGRATFALQYMLDTSLSDAERYPLRQHDLIVMSLNALKAPITVQWGRRNDRHNAIDDLHNVGFAGDHFLRPLFTDTEWRDYEGTVLWVDPAGRGADETAWAVVKSLAGMLFLIHVDGFAGDPAEAMKRIAIDAKKYAANVVEVEPNYGQGMWVTAFQPILMKVWHDSAHIIMGEDMKRVSALQKRNEAHGRMSGCTIQESEWSKGQKETRIIDTLEPVMTAHRLVVDEELIRADVRKDGVEAEKYSLMRQLTHITRERGSLPHEDRLEAVAGAVQHFLGAMAMDTAEAAKGMMDQEKDDLIEDFIEMFEGSPLGIRAGGSGMMRRMRGKQRADGSRTEVTKWSV